MSLKKSLSKIGGTNALLAAVNLITTIAIVRFYGEAQYAAYLVQLSYVSISLLVSELVPTNYSVFKAQDDESWLRTIVPFSIIASLLIGITALAVSVVTNLSPFIALYAALACFKRFIDVDYQASGQLATYFKFELTSAALRLSLMVAMSSIAIAAETAIWGSIATATFLTTALWYYFRGHTKYLKQTSLRAAGRTLWSTRHEFRAYYTGAGLKRLKDSIGPILANMILSDKAALGQFFLAQRGLLFTLGQVRILETFLNYRKNQERFGKLRALDVAVLAFSMQTVSIVASIGILLMAGAEIGNYWETVLALSFSVWIYARSTVHRAAAYARFAAGTVNASLASYCATLGATSLLIYSSGVATPLTYAISLLFAEFVALIVIGRRTLSA